MRLLGLTTQMRDMNVEILESSGSVQNAYRLAVNILKIVSGQS